MDAVIYIKNVQAAAWSSTPENVQPKAHSIKYSQSIKQLIVTKRRARKEWQQSRYAPDKAKLNRISRELDELLQNDKSQKLSAKLQNLDCSDKLFLVETKTVDKTINHKMALRKPDGSWARSDQERVNLFASHLNTVFTPHS